MNHLAIVHVAHSRYNISHVSADRAKDEFEFPPCSICTGKLEVVYDRFHQQVAVCVDCHASLTVPSSSWHIAKLKREGKWKKAPAEPPEGNE